MTEPEAVVQQIHRDMEGRGYNLKLLSQLFTELDMDFSRTHKQIFFDLQPPYDKEKFNAFKSVLPKEMFTPVVERKVDDKGPPALKPMPEGAYKFEDLLVRATENLH